MSRPGGNGAGPVRSKAPAAASTCAGGGTAARWRARVAVRTLPVIAAVALGVQLPLLATAPAAAGQPDGPSAQEVTIEDFSFTPATLTVTAGQTVTFTSDAERPHTVTDRGGTFDTDPVTPGGGAQVTFDVPGVYSFFCRINPGSMNGVVVVAADDRPPSASRVQAHDDVNVDDEQFRFDPATLAVAAGATIHFANVGGQPHTMTAADGSFASGRVAPGPQDGRFSGDTATFSAPDQPGTYSFFCELSPRMQGVLTVVAPADGPTPPPQDPAGTTDGVAADAADADEAGDGLPFVTLLLSVGGALATGLALAALLKRYRPRGRGGAAGA